MSVLKKLLLLSTGGTVASLEGENGLVPGIEPDQLLSYIPDLNEHCQIDSKSLMNLDSTNMQPEDWTEMAQSIHKHYHDYDGFVITHGTDTMAQTAKVLAEKVKNKTIVLTGAMIPIKFGSSDGLFNLGSALAFAQSLAPGVYVVMNGRCFNWDNVRKNKLTGVFEELK